MNAPKRYELEVNGFGMSESCYGEYVEYEDYMTLKLKYDSLQAELAEALKDLHLAEQSGSGS